MLATLIVIISENGTPITTPFLLEGGRRPKIKRKTALEQNGSSDWAPLSDLITIEAANIWEW